MLSNKARFKAFQKIKIIQTLLSDHIGIKLEIDNKGKCQENPQLLQN